MRRVTPNALAISPMENSLSSRFIKNLGVKKSSPAVYRWVAYDLILQKMSKNAREKFGCRGKLPQFSPLAPEAAVRETLPDEQCRAERRQAGLGQSLHALHGVHLLLSGQRDRVRQKERRPAEISL